MERWLSGRKRTIRNRLTGDCSWVRIPPSPFFEVTGCATKCQEVTLTCNINEISINYAKDLLNFLCIELLKFSFDFPLKIFK